MLKTEDSHGMFSDPQFIRDSKMIRSLQKNIASKVERDGYLKDYIQRKRSTNPVFTSLI